MWDSTLYGTDFHYNFPLNIKYLVAAFASLLGEDAYAKVVKLKRKIRPIA